MKKQSLFTSICLSALAIFGSAQARPPSTLYSVAFEEKFDGNSIDTSVWNFRTDNKAFSVQKPSNVAITNGQLSLGMKKEKVLDKSFSGSGIVSKAKFGYGYYEVTAKTTTNKGWHNSWWMMAGDGSTTFGPGRHIEIDSFEIDTSHPETISAGLNIWRDNQNLGVPRCQNPNPPFNSSAGFHTYGVNWYEGYVDFYIDNQRYCSIPYSTKTLRQDPVNLWLTALAYQQPVTVGGTPQLFDNVRYYRRNAYIYSGGFGYDEKGGGWTDSKIPGFGLMPARYSCEPGAKSIYQPRILQTGDYEVYIWKTAAANSDPSAVVSVTYAGGTNTRKVNLRDGQSGWVRLGQYRFNRGAQGQVVNTLNPASNGLTCTRASAVKFIRS
jgi:hypothetical protein